MRLRKALQKTLYDALTAPKIPKVILFTFLGLIIYVFLFQSIDNDDAELDGSPFIGRGCRDPPVDAVITWVNGSDSLFQQSLSEYKKKYLRDLSSHCPYTDCFLSHITATRFSPSLSNSNKLSSITLVNSTDDKSWEIISWSSIDLAREMSSIEITIGNSNVMMSQCYWATETNVPNLILRNDACLVRPMNSTEVLNEVTLRRWLGPKINHLWMYNGSAIIEFMNGNPLKSLLSESPWRVLKIDSYFRVNVSRVNLIMELPAKLQYSDYSPSRFDDKEELRYCLRSLEKHLPWIRHIYLVTNGQIPNWLNLQSKRITVVPHETIFPYKSHLPSFSSSAIETNIHRIPELSELFLYINDDILFGRDVYLDDFITRSEGQKIFLSWPVPDCSASCPWTWVHDGQCDSQCNTVACAFDGGDCVTATRTYDEFDYIKEYDHVENEQTDFSQPRESSTVIRSLMKNYNSTYQIKNLSQHERPHLKRLKMPGDLWSDGTPSRSNLEIDNYALSLIFVNSLFNDYYGYSLRKVPSHMPHLISKRILSSLQNKFSKEFNKTSSNKFRSPDDMQLSFSYYYFLMNEKIYVSPENIFDKFDTDKSGTWSDTEIRTLLLQTFHYPIEVEAIKDFESKLKKCCVGTDNKLPQPPFERYGDSDLPLIRKENVLKCEEVMSTLTAKFGAELKYHHTVVPQVTAESLASFNMITSNVSLLMETLDSIRMKPKKFICLNDNMSEDDKNNDLVRAILYDFYQSLYPQPSEFEIPLAYRNRFIYHKEWMDWESKRKALSGFMFVIAAMFLLILFVLLSTKYDFGEEVVITSPRRTHWSQYSRKR